MKPPQTPAEWAKLVRRVLGQTKAATAAEELAEALCVLAYAFFRRAGLPPEDANDLTQDCVRHIVLCLGQFDGENFKAWVYTILRRKLADHFRELKRCPPTVPLLDSDSAYPDVEIGSDPSRDGSLTPDEQAALEEALAVLNPSERKLMLFRAEGRDVESFRVLSNELRISVSAARVRYHRTKQKLKARLSKDQRMKGWIARHQYCSTLKPKTTLKHETKNQ